MTMAVGIFLASILCGFHQIHSSQAAAVNVNIANRRPFGFGTNRNINVAYGGGRPPNRRRQNSRAGGFLNFARPVSSRLDSQLEYVPAYAPDYGTGYGSGTGYGFANGFGHGGRSGHNNFQYASLAPFPNAQKVDYTHRSIGGFVNLDDPDAFISPSIAESRNILEEMKLLKDRVVLFSFSSARPFGVNMNTFRVTG